MRYVLNQIGAAHDHVPQFGLCCKDNTLFSPFEYNLGALTTHNLGLHGPRVHLFTQLKHPRQKSLSILLQDQTTTGSEGTLINNLPKTRVSSNSITQDTTT